MISLFIMYESLGTKFSPFSNNWDQHTRRDIPKYELYTSKCDQRDVTPSHCGQNPVADLRLTTREMRRTQRWVSYTIEASM